MSQKSEVRIKLKIVLRILILQLTAYSLQLTASFNPFSLTNNGPKAISEIQKTKDVSGTTTLAIEKSDFLEGLELFEELEIEKEDWLNEIERLDKEREILFSKEKETEFIESEELRVKSEEEEALTEPEVEKGTETEEPKEEKEDITLLAQLAETRVKEAENRRKMLTLPQKEYERLKTTPGEALKMKLPEESELNILGRKFIKMGYSGKSLLNTTEKTKTSNQIDINQELEVKIKGIVKKKVTVNIDYSDKSTDLLTPKKTFKVEYVGDKEETIQEVVFGDVTLALHATKFVGYSKSGFGISAKAQALNKKLNVSAIASREKGESRSITQKGTTTLQTQDMQDIGFIKRKFYQVLAHYDMRGDRVYNGRIEWLKNKGYLPIKPGSFQVYIDDKDPNNNTSAISLTGWTHDNSGSYTGSFDLKYPGEDYSFDYNTGILSFKYPLSENYIAFISFTDGLGTERLNLMIKNEKAEEIKKQQVYELFEIRGYYSLPYRKLKFESSDFSFQIIDSSSGRYWYDANSNGLFDSGELTYVRIFGLDREDRYDAQNNEKPGYNKIDKDFLDLDLGLLMFPDRMPYNFGTTGSAGTSNRFYCEDTWINENILSKFSHGSLTSISNLSCYLTTPQSKYTIRIGYSAEKFGLSLNEFNIVPDSESVYIDGTRLSKSEYSIDYETGYITIYRKIYATNEIKVDYEYAPFISGVFQKSLLGTRFEYKPNMNFSLGGTYIGEAGAGLKGAPSVTHPSTSLSVFDVCSKFDITNLLKEKMDYKGPVSLALEGELAHSIQNPNTYGYGMIDSMDSTEDTVFGGISEDAWQISSLPSGIQTPRGKIFYYDKDEKKTYPYQERCGPYISDGGHRTDEKQDKQKMLTFELELGTGSLSGTDSSSWVGLVTSLSKEGIDLSNYSFIEVWSDIPGSSTIKFHLDIGNVSEDSDGNGVLDTEDVNPKDGILNPGEDIGFPFGTETRSCAKNGQLDSEDLDKDGALETGEDISTYLVNDVGTGTGWKLYKIPLNKDQDLRAVKHLRLRLENPGTSNLDIPPFHIDSIAIVGSNWDRPVITNGTGTVSLLGKNSKEDADYVSLLTDPEYKKLHEKEDLKEEGALSISYNFGTLSSAYIRKKLGRTQNYNSYKFLRFWVYGNYGTSSLSLRFGQDDSNCFGYNVGTISQGWNLIKIDLAVFNELLVKKGTENGSFLIRGSPNLGRINEIRFILLANSSGELWLNELHLSDVIKKEAGAYFVEAKGGWDKWLNFAFNTTKQDSSFKTIGPAGSGQEIGKIHFDTNITRFSLFPVAKFNYDKKKNGLSYKNIDEVSNQKFGIDETNDKKIELSFDLNKKLHKGFPVLSGFWKKNDFLYNYSDNNKNGVNSEIGGSITHAYNIERATSSLTTNYGFTKQKGSLTDYLAKRDSNEKDVISHSGKTTLSFAPKVFLSGSNLSLEKQIEREDIKYPERVDGTGTIGTGTIQKNDKDLNIVSLLLKFYPKGPIPKILPKSSLSTEYSISKSIEDIKTSYEGIETNKIIQKIEKDKITEGIGVCIFPYRTSTLTTQYEITQGRETVDSNLAQYIYEKASRNQSTYILHKDQKGSLTIERNKLLFAQNEVKLKEDKSLQLTHRELKYDLDKMEIKKLRLIPLISSTRIDNKFYFLEDYDFKTDRSKHKKRATTSSHLGINNTLGELSFRKYRLGLSTSFTLDANASYDNLSPDEPTFKTLVSTYNDFHNGLLFKRKGPSGDLYSKAKRTASSNTRAFGLNGAWYLYEPLTTNSIFKLTLAESENGVLWSDTISNEINNTLDLLKAKPGLSKRWISSSVKVNYKIDFSHQYTNIAERSTGITHNPYFEWNASWKNNLKTTTILKSTFGDSKEASGLITKNLEIYPSLTGSYEFTKPGFLKIPFADKAISLERKLTLSGNFTTSFKRKKKGKIQEISEDDYKFDVSGTYKIQENTSGTLGLNFSYFTDRVKVGKDYIGYGSYVSLEFKF